MLSDNTAFLYLPLKVPSSVDLDAVAASVSLSTDDENPSLEWFPAERSGDGVRLMVGPDSAVGRLGAGAWWAYVKLEGDGLEDQALVLRAGSFVVEGGAAAGAMPSSAVGRLEFDAAIADLEAAIANLDGAGFLTPAVLDQALSAYALGADLTALAASVNAALAAAAASSRALVRPSWIPADCGTATIDPLGTTVANSALSLNSEQISKCVWYGPDNTAPSAVRFIVGVVGGAITLFRNAVYSADGVLRYVTANEAASVASTGTKVHALEAVGAPYRFAFGEPLHLGWLNVGGTGVQIPRFSSLSAATLNLGFTGLDRRAVVFSGISDLATDVSSAGVSSGIVLLGQLMT